MKVPIVIILIILVSCEDPKTDLANITTDTTKVLELAIRTAFYRHNLPDIGPLMRQYRFKDSILFTSDSLPLSSLPLTLDSLKFKILSKSQICFFINADSNISILPNYLYVGHFEKSDTGYYINIQSRSCLRYGGGGSIGIYIAKDKDSFIVRETHSTSLN